jgi:hypothetical protein
MANRWSLRKALLSSLIGALSLSALVGIYIFVVGDFGETEIKILLTTLSLAYFSVSALGCAVVLERGLARWLPFPGLLSCAFGFFWSLLMIWAEWHREPVAKTQVIAVIVAFSLAQSSLLTLAPLKGNLRWVFGATLAAIFALAALASAMLIFEWEDELLFRLTGVLGILDAAGTLAVPILYKLGHAGPAAPQPVGKVQPTEGWHIELACPRCGHRGRYSVGRIRCPGCSLEVQVGIVDPAGDTGGRRLQFSLRSLLLVTLAASLPLGWIGFRVRERAKQAHAVAALKEHGASVASRYGNVLRVDFWYRSRFDPTALAQLKNLPRLESLFLRNMPVTDQDLRYLEHLELKHLGLTNTDVTDAGLNWLATLSELRFLDVQGTAVTPQGVQTLTRAIPQLYVRTGPREPGEGAVAEEAVDAAGSHEPPARQGAARK